MTTRLGGAVARAAWDVMVRPMWWGVVLLAAFGLAMMLACDSGAPAALAERAAGPAPRALHPQRTVGVVVRIVIGRAPSASPPSSTRWA